MLCLLSHTLEVNRDPVSYEDKTQASSESFWVPIFTKPTATPSYTFVSFWNRCLGYPVFSPMVSVTGGPVSSLLFAARRWNRLACIPSTITKPPTMYHGLDSV